MEEVIEIFLFLSVGFGLGILFAIIFMGLDNTCERSSLCTESFAPLYNDFNIEVAPLYNDFNIEVLDNLCREKFDESFIYNKTSYIQIDCISIENEINISINIKQNYFIYI